MKEQEIQENMKKVLKPLKETLIQLGQAELIPPC